MERPTYRAPTELRRLNLSRNDWQLCKKCGSRHPDELFTAENGEPRKTCNNCRAARNKRRTGCDCNKCSYCARRRKLEEAQATDEVYAYRYDSWEMLGHDSAYFLPLRKPLKEIAKLYGYT